MTKQKGEIEKKKVCEKETINAQNHFTMAELQNVNPVVLDSNSLPIREAVRDDPFEAIYKTYRQTHGLENDNDDSGCLNSKDAEPIDEQEIYDLLSTISDPEHPLTLAQLAVVSLHDIEIIPGPIYKTVRVKIRPTVNHCSMATLIGLCIRVRLERSLPSSYRIDINVKEGSHQSENQVNKQLNDKERVAAACENTQLMSVLAGMMETCK